MEQIKSKLYKLFWAIVELAITFLIKIYIMNTVPITSNAGVDKVLFSCVSIVLILLSIKNFVDISISKKEIIKLSVWHKLLIYGVLVMLACLIWWLMNYELFWIFLGAFIVSYVIVFFKRLADLRAINEDKKELKHILQNNYDVKIERLKPYKKDERVFVFGGACKFTVVMIKSPNLAEEIVIDAVDDFYNLEVVKNEDGKMLSQIKDINVILISGLCINEAVKLIKEIQKAVGDC